MTRHPASFTVEGVVEILFRGPAITLGDEAARAARDAGERFTAGDVVVCRSAELRARVVGVEHYAIPNAPDGSLLLSGLSMDEDISVDQLVVGQVWELEL